MERMVSLGRKRRIGEDREEREELDRSIDRSVGQSKLEHESVSSQKDGRNKRWMCGCKAKEQWCIIVRREKEPDEKPASQRPTDHANAFSRFLSIAVCLLARSRATAAVPVTSVAEGQRQGASRRGGRGGHKTIEGDEPTMDGTPSGPGEAQKRSAGKEGGGESDDDTTEEV